MNARLVLTPETKRQISTKGKLLLYLQKHPNMMKNTNLTVMAGRIRLADDSDSLKLNAKNSLRQALWEMEHKTLLIRHGSRNRANFHINYFSPSLPGYVLDEAPEETQKRVKEWWKQAESTADAVEEDGTIVQLSNTQTPSVVDVQTKPIKDDNTNSEQIVKDILVDGKSGANFSITFNIRIG